MLGTGRDWLMFIYAACCGGSSLLVYPSFIMLSYLCMRNCPGALGHPTPVQECFNYSETGLVRIGTQLRRD